MAAAPLFTYKFFAEEGGLRTPLIISNIPGARANRISPTLTDVTDIMPALLEVPRMPAPEGSLSRPHGRVALV